MISQEHKVNAQMLSETRPEPQQRGSFSVQPLIHNPVHTCSLAQNHCGQQQEVYGSLPTPVIGIVRECEFRGSKVAFQ